MFDSDVTCMTLLLVLSMTLLLGALEELEDRGAGCLVLGEAEVRVAHVVKVNVRELGLDERPDAPIQMRRLQLKRLIFECQIQGPCSFANVIKWLTRAKTLAST